MSRSRAGGKFTKTHSTVIPAAEKLVDAANQCPEVTHIALGIIINGKGGGNHRLKLSQMSGGIRAFVRGPTSMQELYFYTKDPERTQQMLEKAFGR